MLTRQKCSKQHPYGVSPGSIALVDHSPPRASRFSTESRPFADLGRFCAPNSRLFTPNDRSFWISSSTYSSLPFLFLGVYQPSPGKQRGLISLISLISHFCYIFCRNATGQYTEDGTCAERRREQGHSILYREKSAAPDLRCCGKLKLLKGTACLAAASLRPYITNLKSVRL
jgi:hypothetical protein